MKRAVRRVATDSAGRCWLCSGFACKLVAGDRAGGCGGLPGGKLKLCRRSRRLKFPPTILRFPGARCSRRIGASCIDGGPQQEFVPGINESVVGTVRHFPIRGRQSAILLNYKALMAPTVRSAAIFS